MRSARHRGQEGFIREVVWLALGLAIIAIVMLDAMALFTAHNTVRDDAATAAKEARTTYAQYLDVRAARAAAKTYLENSGDRLLRFKAVKMEDGTAGFTVTCTTSAKTYGFKYLAHVPGLSAWVRDLSNPVCAQTSD